MPTGRGRIAWLFTIAILALGLTLSFALLNRSESGATSPSNVDLGRPAKLPAPSSMSVAEFENVLFEFLNARKYVELGWRRDKGVRDTGPYIDGKYLGTHPAVRVYYSPGVVRWLMNGREGPIPDGEMIIKEQFAAPAVRHERKSDAELWNSLDSWTVMVKDSAGSHDGWFWSNPIKGQCSINNHQYPYDHPVSGFGHYCVRCHAATESPGCEASHRSNEFTFASLRNIAGFPGEPIQFSVDNSWREKVKEGGAPSSEGSTPHPKCVRPKPPEPIVRKPNVAFLSFFRSVKPTDCADVAKLPPSTHDWVFNQRNPTHQFVTSNQCMNCHSGLVAPFGPSMFVPAGKSTEYGAPGRDVSPYGEWRWTAMGLAGRDPIFFAQLESEVRMIQNEFGADPAYAAELGATLVDHCLRCHGAMGRRQLEIDHAGNKKMALEHVHSICAEKEPIGLTDARYGALARDGVSCAVCHRMQPRPQPAHDTRHYLQHFLETSITGNYHLGDKGEIYGPFEDKELSPYAMEHATGLKPKHSPFLKSSQLCGTCHTVVLPSIDWPVDANRHEHEKDDLVKTQTVPALRGFHHQLEQSTYLEWLNSEFENEINPNNPKAKSCQDCHMATGLKDERHGIDLPKLNTRIAAIQDHTYPEAENTAAKDKLEVRMREQGYRRHSFSGLNAFLLEMFNQCDDILGVPKTDFMTGSAKGVEDAIHHMTLTARDDVATVSLKTDWESKDRLAARVLVTNKVGHRFPSGVGFRRAILEVTVAEKAADGAERIVWASGRTNELGIVIGPDNEPLPTEFFTRDPKTGQQQFQDHHEVIDAQDQVQIYESLMRNYKGQFTTSFVRGCKCAKDNRLLPRGWKHEGPGPALTGRFLAATHPDAKTAQDPQYADGSGTDETLYRISLPAGVDPARVRVRATLYYQAIPPYFLRNLFETAPDGPATQRLHHIAHNLNLAGRPIENWKLRIASAESAPVRP